MNIRFSEIRRFRKKLDVGVFEKCIFFFWWVFGSREIFGFVLER